MGSKLYKEGNNSFFLEVVRPRPQTSLVLLRYENAAAITPLDGAISPWT